MSSPNEMKKGTVINYENDLWVVVDFQRVSPGKGGSFVRTKMKSLSSGKVIDNNFKAAENMTYEDVSYKKMQYIFADDNTVTFMDNTSFEQVLLGRDVVGDDVKYLKEGLAVTVVMHNDAAIAMELPGKIQYEIKETADVVKGDTASGNVMKDAKADNNLMIRVPAFIHEGDQVNVNTETGEYVERVSK